MEACVDAVGAQARQTLDLETLGGVQAAVAVSAFGLVFLGTYRTTGVPFAGWWSATLAASGLTTATLVMGETFRPVVTAAIGNAISVLGAYFTWMAALSLRGGRRGGHRNGH